MDAKMYLRLGLMMCMVLMAVVSCHAPVLETVPEDFSFTYNFYGATTPPPYHYEYEINMTAEGKGTVYFRPNYGMEADTEYVVSFTVDEKSRKDLYKEMRGVSLFSISAASGERPVGGDLEWLTVRAEGKKYDVPSYPKKKEKVRKIYEKIRNLVPQKKWDSLFQKRENYMEEFKENGE